MGANAPNVDELADMATVLRLVAGVLDRHWDRLGVADRARLTESLRRTAGRLDPVLRLDLDDYRPARR